MLGPMSWAKCLVPMATEERSSTLLLTGCRRPPRRLVAMVHVDMPWISMVYTGVIDERSVAPMTAKNLMLTQAEKYMTRERPLPYKMTPSRHDQSIGKIHGSWHSPTFVAFEGDNAH